MLWVRLSWGRRRGCLLSGNRLRSSRGRRSIRVWAPVRKCCDVLLVFYKNGDLSTERNVLCTLGIKKLGNETLFLHLEIDGGLVSLNGCEDVTWTDLVADLLSPRFDVAL